MLAALPLHRCHPPLLLATRSSSSCWWYSATLIGRDILAATKQAKAAAKKAQAKDAAAAAAATAASGTTGSTAGHCDRGGARAVKKAVGVSHIYDLACGHGLLGILLAYRFPRCEVRSLPRAHLLSHMLVSG